MQVATGASMRLEVSNGQHQLIIDPTTIATRAEATDMLKNLKAFMRLLPDRTRRQKKAKTKAKAVRPSVPAKRSRAKGNAGNAVETDAPET